ncbi:MAG TPA: hypothetical protein VIL74_18020 [Pyrinomonadaceae bacterium]|jgi:uncharacterized protein (DUF983 family)
MFCAACGKAVMENLNYCNACGAKIGKNDLDGRGASSPYLSAAVGFIGVAGLFGFVMVLKMLLDNSVDPTVMVIILISYLVTLFLLCAVLVGHIWKHTGDFRVNINQPAEDYAPPKRMPGVNTNQLEAPREPFIGSVTENTTRVFDRTPIEEK